MATLAVNYHERDRPPLANELFDDRFGQVIDTYPKCRPLITNLRLAAQSGGSIESRLSEFEAQSSDYPARKTHLAAIKSYLRAVVQQTEIAWFQQCNGVTNYIELVDRLERLAPRLGDKRICYVTFNYDTLLEVAIRDVIGKNFRELSDYIARPGPIVIKPHGSITWSQRVQLPFNRYEEVLQYGSDDGFERALIDHFDEVTETSLIENHIGFTAVHNRDVQKGTADFALPAIAIPFDQKSVFVCPDDHLEVLKEALEDTTHLLVIGWRATEATFLQMLADALRDKPVKGSIANGSMREAQEVEDRLRSSGVDIEWRSTDLGFTTLLRAEMELIVDVNP